MKDGERVLVSAISSPLKMDSLGAWGGGDGGGGYK